MTDVDGLHSSFLTTDENGQRLFAIRTVAPATVSAMAGATLTIRGSGFQSGTIVTINGKSAAVTFKVPTLFLVVIPSLTPGSQQIVITNPDGESVSLDAAFFAN